MDSAIGVHSGIDSPALALFNPPPSQKQLPHAKSRPVSLSLAHAPRTFVTRSLHNIRHGNAALLIVFVACLIIFVRALFGAGYDEGSSADADAAVQKHPSLLARWGPQSQHALEQQWRRLRSRGASSGLWAKIRKEDEHPHPHSTSEHGPLHWLRAVEDRAFGWHTSSSSSAAPEQQPDAPAVQAPVQHVHSPEHDISEDLDAHDAVDEDELHSSSASSSSLVASATEAAPPVQSTSISIPADSDSPREPAAPVPERVLDTPSDDPASSAAPEPQPAAPPAAAEPAYVPPAEVDPEHDDTDDEPVYHRREETK